MKPPRELPAGKTIFITAEDFAVFWPKTALEAHAIELVSIDDNSVVLRMPLTDAVRQPMGLLHGGMSLMLAESAASLHAARGVDLSRRAAVGVEVSGSHVKACAEGFVRAEATVLSRTNSFVVHQVEILQESTRERISICRVTNYYTRVGTA